MIDEKSGRFTRPLFLFICMILKDFITNYNQLKNDNLLI